MVRGGLSCFLDGKGIIVAGMVLAFLCERKKKKDALFFLYRDRAARWHTKIKASRFLGPCDGVA